MNRIDLCNIELQTLQFNLRGNIIENILIELSWCITDEEYEAYFEGTESILPENNWHKSGISIESKKQT